MECNYEITNIDNDVTFIEDMNKDYEQFCFKNRLERMPLQKDHLKLTFNLKVIKKER